jgi:hypothetical protein
MRFLSIIRGPEGVGEPPQALMDAMGKYIQESFANGSLVETGGLAPSSKGARIRSSGGKLSVIDGPFTEAKEVVGGYALLEAPSREAALAYTRRFMQLHSDHWPEWEGECELRELQFFAP